MKVRKIVVDGSTRSDRYLYYSNGSSDHTGPTFTPGSYSTIITYGDNIPDWKHRIKTGQNATTSLSVSGTKPGKKRGTYHWSRSWPSIYIFPNGIPSGAYGFRSEPFVPFQSSFTLSESQAYDECVIGFLQAVENVNRKFQSGIFFGELRETVHMLRSPFESLTAAFHSYLGNVLTRSYKWKRLRSSNALRNSGKQKKASLKRLLSDTWLEYSFGWRPFISDINSAINTLNALSRAPQEYEKVSFSVMKEDPVRNRYQTSANIPGDGLGSGFNILESEKIIVKLYGAVNVDQTTKGANRLLGLTVSEFVPTVWELIPYSFLVDYFANVGGFIAALCVKQSNLRWKSKTVVKVVTAKAVSTYTNGLQSTDSGIFHDTQSSSLSCTPAEFKSIERHPENNILVPSLVFRIPGTETRWLNMAALGLASTRTSQRIGRL